MTAPSIFFSQGFTSTANNTTVYGAIIGSSTMGTASGATTTTESLAANTVSTAGTLNNWYQTEPTNTRNVNTVFTVRKNSADTALAFTWTSGQTGTKTDTSTNVTVAQDDTIDLSINFSNGTGGFGSGFSCLRFTPSSGTTQSYGGFDGTGVTLSGTGPITDFLPFAGQLPATTTTEAEAQFRMPLAGTAKYMQMNVVTNGRSTDTVVTFRKNAGNGNQTFTYTSGQTGNKVDTSNTDSITADDLLCCSPVLGTGTGNFIVNNCAFWMDSTTDGESAVATAQASGRSFAAASTLNQQFAGRLQGNSVEANAQAEMGTAVTFSKIWLYVKTNASTTNAAMKFRSAGADKNQNVSITALTTGVFKDDTHSDAVSTTAAVNYQFTGATTGAVTITAISMKMVTARAITLTSALGTYTLTGIAAGLRAARKLVSDKGTFTLTGIAAAFKWTHKLVAAQGTYVLTGVAAGLKRGLKVTASQGTYVLTGVAAALRAARKLVSDIGVYALTGIDAALRKTKLLIAATGTYTLTGIAAGLVKHSVATFKLVAGIGSYILTGKDVRFYNSGAPYSFTFSGFVDPSLMDWNLATYESFLHTLYAVPDTTVWSQTPYLYTFLAEDENSTADTESLVGNIGWNWADVVTDPNKKVTRDTQLYKYNGESLVGVSKRKMRGKGRALQMRFASEGQKNFNLLGWAVWLTSTVKP